MAVVSTHTAVFTHNPYEFPAPVCDAAPASGPTEEAALVDLCVRYLRDETVNPYHGVALRRRTPRIVTPLPQVAYRWKNSTACSVRALVTGMVRWVLWRDPANRARRHRRHRTLYENVLGPTKRKHRALLRVLAKYPDVFAFCEDGVQRPSHRVRLVVHCSWRRGDDRQAGDRARREQALRYALCCFLCTQPSGSGRIDDFMAVYGASLPSFCVSPWKTQRFCHNVDSRTAGL